MTWEELLKKLADGKGYKFYHKYLDGFFYKAPFDIENQQADPRITKFDGAMAAITFWNKEGTKLYSPTLMLYDFDDETEWFCEEAEHPMLKKLETN